MRTAAQYSETRLVQIKRPAFEQGIAAFANPECSFIFYSEITGSGDWNVNDAKYRFFLFDERNVDGEFTVALDKFLSAIQRIDQPAILIGAALFIG